MRDRDLYRTFLGIVESWSVSDVDPKSDEHGVVVFIRQSVSVRVRCPRGLAVWPRRDKRALRLRPPLRHAAISAFLVAQVPGVTCARHGTRQTDVPRAAERSRFTTLFEMLVIDRLDEPSMNAVCCQLGPGRGVFHGIMQRADRRDDVGLYPDLKVDETALRKRHDHVAVISDPGTGAVTHLRDDQKKASLAAFHASLSDEQRDGIRSISLDMWPAFIDVLPESIPAAESKIAVDSFTRRAASVRPRRHGVPWRRQDIHVRRQRDFRRYRARLAPSRKQRADIVWRFTPRILRYHVVDSLRVGLGRIRYVPAALPLTHSGDEGSRALVQRRDQELSGADQANGANDRTAPVGLRERDRHRNHELRCGEHRQPHRDGEGGHTWVAKQTAVQGSDSLPSRRSRSLSRSGWTLSQSTRFPERPIRDCGIEAICGHGERIANLQNGGRDEEVGGQLSVLGIHCRNAGSRCETRKVYLMAQPVILGERRRR